MEPDRITACLTAFTQSSQGEYTTMLERAQDVQEKLSQPQATSVVAESKDALRPSQELLDVVYDKPRLHACKLSKFTMKQMAKQKNKKKRGCSGSRHPAYRKAKQRRRWQAFHDNYIHASRTYSRSLRGMYTKARRYKKGMEIMSLAEWIDMWYSCPPVWSEREGVLGWHPAYVVRSNKPKHFPRVQIERVDKSKGYVLGNIEIWLLEQKRTTLLLSC